MISFTHRGGGGGGGGGVRAYLALLISEGELI